MTGEQIRVARQARGWSQEFLAGKLGVSMRSVNLWENGRIIPGTDNQARLKAVLGYTPSKAGLNQGESSQAPVSKEKENPRKIEDMTSLKEVQKYMCAKNMFKNIDMCLECDGILTCKAGQKAMSLLAKEDPEKQKGSVRMDNQTTIEMNEEEFDAVLMTPDPVSYLMEQYNMKQEAALFCMTESQKKYSRTVWENASVHDDPISWYMNVFKVTRHVAQNRLYNYRKKFKNVPASESRREAPENKQDPLPKTSAENHDDDEITVFDFLQEQENNKREPQTIKEQAHKPKYDNMTVLEETVLSCLRDDPWIKREGLIKKTGKSIRTITRVLASLKERHLIIRIGPNVGGYWQITDLENAGMPATSAEAKKDNEKKERTNTIYAGQAKVLSYAVSVEQPAPTSNVSLKNTQDTLESKHREIIERKAALQKQIESIRREIAELEEKEKAILAVKEMF